MVKVILKRNLNTEKFGRIRKGVGKRDPVEVPDELRDHLPKDAEIVDDDYVASAPEKEPDTLGEMADVLGMVPELAAAEIVAGAEEKAEAQIKYAQDKAAAKARDERTRTETAKKFQEDLEAEAEAPATSDTESKTPKTPKRGPGRPKKS